MATFLTAQQVAERWGCSERTVQRLAQTGELPAMRLGSSWRVCLAALEAYEALHANTPAPAASGSAPSNEVAKREVLGAPKNPVFPHLWGMAPATRTGTKKAALSSN